MRWLKVTLWLVLAAVVLFPALTQAQSLAGIVAIRPAPCCQV